MYIYLLFVSYNIFTFICLFSLISLFIHFFIDLLIHIFN